MDFKNFWQFSKLPRRKMYMLQDYISWCPVRRLPKSLGPRHQTSGPGIGGNRSMFLSAREAKQNKREYGKPKQKPR